MQHRIRVTNPWNYKTNLLIEARRDTSAEIAF